MRYATPRRQKGGSVHIAGHQCRFQPGLRRVLVYVDFSDLSFIDASSIHQVSALHRIPYCVSFADMTWTRPSAIIVRDFRSLIAQRCQCPPTEIPLVLYSNFQRRAKRLLDGGQDGGLE